MLNTDVFTIPLNHKLQIVYIPLKQVTFLVNNESVKIINLLRTGKNPSNKNINHAIIRRLTELSVIGNKKNDKISLLPNFKIKPTKVVILPTETCNLGCTYCYAGALPLKNRIKWEAIEAAVNLIIHNAKLAVNKNGSITFLGGGEPTVHWDLLVRTTDFARNKSKSEKVKLHISLVTNGTLLTEEKINWLSINMDHITVSFDILPSIQNEQRPYAGGLNSYEKVEQTIKILLKYKCSIGIRSTITQNSVSYMSKMVKYLDKTLKGINKIQFEPLTELGRSLTTNTVAPDQHLFVKEFFKARRIGQKLGIKIDCSMSNIINKLRRRFCYNEFSITSEGLVTGCHRFSRINTNSAATFIYGYFDGQKYIFNKKKFISLQSANVFKFKKCDNCFAKWNCAGDCLATRIYDNKISQIGKRCYIVRNILKATLIERLQLAQNGGSILETGGVGDEKIKYKNN